MAKQLDYTKLNPRKIRRARLEVNHTFKINELGRLQDWLADELGEVTVQCDFKWELDDSILMTLAIDGDMTVLCKRCLGPFPYKWSSRSILALDEEDVINEDSSDLDYERVLIGHDGSFNLIDVVIDEIILGLPEYHVGACPQNLVFEA
jgi:large subunit ribosomal protein L32